MKKILIVILMMLFLTVPAFAEENRYNFDCQDTQLSKTLYAIAHRDGKDVVIQGKVEGTVLMTLNNKTVGEAFDLLAKAFNFNWIVDGDVVVITPSDTMTQNKRFILKFANLKQVKEAIMSGNILEKNISINTDYNSISVDGTPFILQKAEKIITEMDTPIQQFFIMAQVIEISRSDALKVGFNYTLPSYDSSVKPFKIQYTVTSNFNETFGKGKILARPSITTQNGIEASLLMGDKVPTFSSTTSGDGSKTTTITYQDVGVKLLTTARVNDKENKIITLKLHPTVSSITKWITSDSVTAPQISTREADTVVRVKSGETIIISGLMRQEEIENLSGIPGLMNLPLLGKLFQYREKSKSQTEVFVTVTPYLLDGDTVTEAMQTMLQDGKKQTVQAPQVPAAPEQIKTEVSAVKINLLTEQVIAEKAEKGGEEN